MITGSRGFLGRRLVSAIAASGDEVLGIDRLPIPHDKPMPNTYVHLSGTFEVHSDAAVKFLKGVSPARRLVFHLAGIANAGECERNPRMAYEANVELTERVVEALAGAGGGGIVFPSSGLVYGDRGERPFTENSPLTGSSVYAQTKIQAESAIASRSSKSPIRAFITRLSNVYGSWMSEQTVAGRILAQAACGRSIRVYDEASIRDFIHAEDVITAFRKLADELPEEGVEAVNISSGVATSIEDLAVLAADLFGVGHLSPELGRQSDDARSYLVLSNDHLKQLTDWKPEIGLREGLMRSVMEMRKHAGHET